jgi:hypothetical protein
MDAGHTCHRYDLVQGHDFTGKPSVLPQTKKNGWISRTFNVWLEYGHMIFSPIHEERPRGRELRYLARVMFCMDEGRHEVMLYNLDGTNGNGWERSLCWHKSAQDWVNRCRLEYRRLKLTEKQSRKLDRQWRKEQRKKLIGITMERLYE